MINSIDKILYKKIGRISPSQFFSMRFCPYKSVLAEAFNKTPLLPISPNAYLGIVVHKILELISRGQISNEAELNHVFSGEINLLEKTLVTQGYGFYTPLNMNIRDFGTNKILLKEHLLARKEKTMRARCEPEKWFESKNGCVGGKIDLLIESSEYTEILDFKTGAITADATDDNGETILGIKTEYKEQIKLYAYLYFENTGKWPTKLSLVNLSKKKFNVPFSRDECQGIFNSAVDLLNEINDGINTRTFSANPSIENCKYCLYRPACSFFLKQLEIHKEYNDVTGIVNDSVKYLNGNVTAFLQLATRVVSITGLNSTCHDLILQKKNKKIAVFNVKHSNMENVFVATKTTTLYD